MLTNEEILESEPEIVLERLNIVIRIKMLLDRTLSVSYSHIKSTLMLNTDRK